MDKILFAFSISYLAVTVYFFTNWLSFYLRHPSDSPLEVFLSFVMFIITTIFWPVVLLMSCLEMFKTGKLELVNIIAVLVAISAFSFSFYLK